jgi:hypothetical protein
MEDFPRQIFRFLCSSSEIAGIQLSFALDEAVAHTAPSFESPMDAVSK